MRLIDADKLSLSFEDIDFICPNDCTDCPFVRGNNCILEVPMSFVQDKIREQETVVIGKHGHWVELSGLIPVGLKGTHYCSLCGCPAPYHAGFREMLSDWCPSCGAKMYEE